MDNKKEFLALIERYETIELDEIKAKMVELGFKNGFNIVAINPVTNALTGFGEYSTCTLCIPLRNNTYSIECDKCMWIILTEKRCCCDENKETYIRIANANTAVKIRNACRARAKYMRKVLGE